MYHIFVQASIEGRVSCFHVLAPANNGTMNIRVHISLQINVFKFLGRYLEERLLSNMVTLVLIFEEPPYCFP